MTFAPLACGLLALCAAGLAAACLRASPVLIINESASLPKGVYRLTSEPPALGAIVAFQPSPEGRRYLARLGAGPDARLLKRVVATEGDLACRTRDRLTWPRGSALALAQDRRGRDLPQWQGCHRLGAREVLVLGDTPLSFDSRYLGAIRADELLGAYREVWRW